MVCIPAGPVRLFRRVVRLSTVLAVVAGPTAARQQSRGAFGQDPPGTVPQVFAPGVISTAAREFSISFSPDGKEAYFTRTGVVKQHTVMVTVLKDGSWTAPAPLQVTREWDAFEPCVSADGSRLYFVSGTATSMDLWYLERGADGWSEPVHPGPPFNPGRAMFASTTLDGSIYTTFAPGGPPTADIAVTRPVAGGEYSEFQVLGPEINSAGQDAYPYVAPDGSYLLLASVLPNGGHAIFVSFRKPDGGWTERQAVDLGGLQAGLPWVSPDGKYLFFTAGNDIYWVDSVVFTSLKPGKAR